MLKQKERLKVIAFDNYGTLEDIHTDEDVPRLWLFLAHFMRMQGADWTPDELRAAYQSTNELHTEDMIRISGEPQVEIDLAQTFRTLYRLRGVSADDTLTALTMQAFRAASTDYFRLYPGTIEMLRGLRENGLRIALLSNAQSLFTRPELNALGTDRLFDQVFISSEHGIKKPSPAFYRLLIDWAGEPPEHIMMVGNSPSDDIIPANALGLQTFYVRSELTEKDAATPPSTCYLPEPDMPRMLRMILARC